MDEQEPVRKPELPLVFPCSGASDVGGITDRAARDLDRNGIARMYCLAGIGAKVQEIVSNSQVAERLVSVDGCENDCSRKMLEAAGFKPALHFRLTDLGLPKGNSPATEERIREVAEAIRRSIDDESR